MTNEELASAQAICKERYENLFILHSRYISCGEKMIVAKYCRLNGLTLAQLVADAESKAMKEYQTTRVSSKVLDYPFSLAVNALNRLSKGVDLNLFRTEKAFKSVPFNSAGGLDKYGIKPIIDENGISEMDMLTLMSLPPQYDHLTIQQCDLAYKVYEWNIIAVKKQLLAWEESILHLDVEATARNSTAIV